MLKGKKSKPENTIKKDLHTHTLAEEMQSGLFYPFPVLNTGLRV